MSSPETNRTLTMQVESLTAEVLFLKQKANADIIKKIDNKILDKRLCTYREVMTSINNELTNLIVRERVVAAERTEDFASAHIR
jgi:hypothetical protein